MPSWHLGSAVLPGLSQGKTLWEVLRRVWSQLGFPSLWIAPCALAMSNFLRLSHKRGLVDWWPYIVSIEHRSVVMLSKHVNTYWNIFILEIERIYDLEYQCVGPCPNTQTPQALVPLSSPLSSLSCPQMLTDGRFDSLSCSAGSLDVPRCAPYIPLPSWRSFWVGSASDLIHDFLCSEPRIAAISTWSKPCLAPEFVTLEGPVVEDPGGGVTLCCGGG